MRDLFATFIVHLIEICAPILVAISVPLSIIYLATRFT